MRKLSVVVLVLVAIGVAGDRAYAWATYQVRAPMSATPQPVDFHVAQGETTTQISADLQAKGLIRSAQMFELYLEFGSAHRTIQAGDFTLNRDMNADQIIATLGRGRVQQVSVTLPEGDTMAIMAQVAQQAGVGKAQDYLAAAKDMAWPYDFLQGRPRGAPANLEGFLFPDTYQLDPGSAGRDLVKRQLDRFAQAFTPAMRAAVAQPTPNRPAESLYNVVTLASIVEREVKKDPDRAIVCGIFYNRLAAGMPLDDDVTVLYGLGKLQGPLTEPDKQKDTPFNTYLHPGLPAGPISNPGLATLNACVSPQKSAYYYFFADAHGVTRYARTLAEFQRQQQQYGLAPGG